MASQGTGSWKTKEVGSPLILTIISFRISMCSSLMSVLTLSGLSVSYSPRLDLKIKTWFWVWRNDLLTYLFELIKIINAKK